MLKIQTADGETLTFVPAPSGDMEIQRSLLGRDPHQTTAIIPKEQIPALAKYLATGEVVE